MVTKYPSFGSVADNTNPYLRMGFKKLALESRKEVLMPEHFSVGVTRVSSKDAPPYLRQHRCVQILMQKFANKTFIMGRVLLLLGKQNYRNFRNSAAFAPACPSASGLIGKLY